jgi:hypothetical protein
MADACNECDPYAVSVADVLAAQLDGSLPYPALKRLVRFLRDAHQRYPRRPRRDSVGDGRRRRSQGSGSQRFSARSPVTRRPVEPPSPTQIPSPPLCSATPCSLPPRPTRLFTQQAHIRGTTPGNDEAPDGLYNTTCIAVRLGSSRGDRDEAEAPKPVFSNPSI